MSKNIIYRKLLGSIFKRFFWVWSLGLSVQCLDLSSGAWICLLSAWILLWGAWICPSRAWICLLRAWICLLGAWICPSGASNWFLTAWMCLLGAWICLLDAWNCFWMLGFVCWVNQQITEVASSGGRHFAKELNSYLCSLPGSLERQRGEQVNC